MLKPMSRSKLRQHCTIVSRCTDQMGSPYDGKKCGAIHYSNGDVVNNCGDPCSFIMRKAGSGNPPYLHSDDLIKEIHKLMLRESRGILREG